MLLLILISSFPETGLDSLYYRFVPVDTNLYQEFQVAEEEGGEINLSGTKSFSVSYGDQGLLFDQGMWINFAGSAGDVTIDGAIADQEGQGEITKSLFEIENTRIGFKAPWGSGRVGDLTLTHDLYQGRIEQQGVGGELGVGPIKGGIAVSKGHYRRKRIRAENHQGPYVIDDQGIVPASEQVYLDGELVIKGIDYLIDYDAGSITFTPTKPITPIDRIEVHYLTNAVPFLRLSGYGNLLVGKNQLGFIEDYEDPDQPIGFIIDRTQRSALEAAGDSLVWVDGSDTLTGGDYIKVSDHYQFAGWGDGDYQVKFTYVGADSGDYLYDQDIHAYRWVGSGGDYVARVKIAPPAKDQLIYTNSQFDFGSINVTFEPSLSICDHNLASKKDDDDNLGAGVSGRLEYKKGPDLFLDVYERSERHQFPIQTDYDLNYRWGLDSDVEMLSRYQAGISFHHQDINLILGAGLLNRTWPRAEGGIGFKNGHLRYARFLERFRFDGNYEIPIFFLTPGLGLLWENDRRISYGQVKISDLAKLKYQTIQDTVGKGNGVDLQLSPIIGPVRGILSWTRSRWEGKDWDLLNLMAGLSYPISISGNFSLNREVRRRYDEFYIQVDPQEGDYRLDTLTGQYIRDPDGDYVRQIHYLDQYDITNIYIYRFVADLDFASFELGGNLDDATSQFQGSGDLVLPVGMIDLKASGEYSRDQDRTIDELDTDLDLEAGPFVKVSQSWRVGPFGHYQRARETEAAAVIRQERTRGVKIRGSNTGPFSMDAYLGFDLIKAESPVYFPELNRITINKPVLGIDLSLPVFGLRLFSSVDFSYVYSAQEIPGFFSILHPPGPTAFYRIGCDRQIGKKSTISLAYNGRYHPEYQFSHNLNFSTRIRF